MVKVIEHNPLGFSMFTILSFKNIENDAYRGEDCMINFVDP